MKTCLAFIVILISLNSYCQSWESTDGPPGTYFRELEAGKDFVFGSNVSHGLFRSPNGVSWEKLDLPIPQFGIFKFSVSGDSVLLTGNLKSGPSSYRMIFSEDNGESWNEINLPKDENFVISKFSKNKIVIQHSEHIFCSLDFGETWTESLQFNDGDIFTNPGNLQTYDGQFYLNYVGGIYKAKDNFESWDLIPGTENIGPSYFSKNIIIGKKANSQEIIKSEDFGNSWITIFDNLSTQNYNFYSRDSTLYVYRNDIYSSNDYGKSWQKIETPYGGIGALAYFFNMPIITIGTFGPPMYKKTGKEWKAGSLNLSHPVMEGLETYKNDILTSTDNNGIWRYDTETEKWQNERFIKKWQNERFKVIGNEIITGSYFGDTLRLYSDEAQQWKYPEIQKVFNLQFNQITGFYNLNNEGIFVTSGSSLAPYRISFDGGNNFEIFNYDTTKTYQGEIFSMYQIDSIIYIDGELGVHYSSDKGKNWDKLEVPDVPNDQVINGLFIDNDVIMVTPKTNGREKHYFSYDKGQTWTSTVNSFESIRKMLAIKDVILLHTKHGIRLSSNRGIGWSSICCNGFPNFSSPNYMAFANEKIFIALNTLGVYKKDLSNYFTSGNKEIHSSQGYTVHPNPSKNNPIYLKNENGKLFSAEYRLFDLNGNIMTNDKRKNIASIKIETIDLQKGIYFLQIIDSTGMTTKKVIIN